MENMQNLNHQHKDKKSHIAKTILFPIHQHFTKFSIKFF